MSVVAFEFPSTEETARRRSADARVGEADPTRTPLLLAVLERAGLSEEDYAVAARDAAATGGDVAEALVARGWIGEIELGRAMAAALDFPFAHPAAQDRAVDGAGTVETRFLRTCTLALETKLFVAPRLETLDNTAGWLRRWQGERTVVTTMSALRAHEARRSEAARSQAARLSLSYEHADWSARTVLTARQGYGLGLLTCALVLAAFHFGSALWIAAHLALSLLFFACTLFRLAVLVDLDREWLAWRRDRDRRENRISLPAGPLPVYTILVALYREEEMAAPLAEALARLNWPRSRLDIKLICEADDAPTIAAVDRAIDERAGFERVCVPPSHPRTKPKALNHALPLARGDFVVLYDAEDRPDPDQLLEAWVAFETSGPDLACVQAPLAVRNGGRNWMTALFALEYAVLFRALLPFLARRRLPIPLGGTSNHFRRSVLTTVGGWDSHNVAEDADLGIRLARFGYRTDVITAPTSEIAPVRLRDWMRQRSRWIKGWIQTYCVHTRDLRRATRELGRLRMAAFQFLFFSMVAGTVMHSIFLVHLAIMLVRIAVTGEATLGTNGLMALDLFNITAAAVVFAALARRVVSPSERSLLRSLWGLWAYWLLVSIAGGRAIRQLFTAPHHWDKTPHSENGGTETSSVPEATPNPGGLREA